MITTENITITPQELAYEFRALAIGYAGVPPPAEGYLLYIIAGIAIAAVIVMAVLLKRR